MTDPEQQKPESGTGPTALQRQLPNMLTIARLVLAVAFFAVLSPFQFKDQWFAAPAGAPPAAPAPVLLIAAGLFVIAAATDALDGFLARRWNVVSVFGRVMDPFADKVLVLGAFVLLAGSGFAVRFSNPVFQLSAVEPWMVVVILARELLVTSIRAVAESKGIEFSASLSGKLKMILQSLVIPAVLLVLSLTPVVRVVEATAGPVFERTAAGMFVLVLVWLTVAVTVWSGIPYITRGMAAMRTIPPGSASKPPAPGADKPV